MFRACPRCGDFHADGTLLFCPADGTPLADVDTHGDTWAEAARVVEEKGRLLRRQTRRLRLRRVLMMTTSVLITTLVVFVVAVNMYVYLAPQPDAPVVAAALTPTPTPTPRRSESPTWTPTPETPSSLPFVPAVTPTPTPEVTPTPDRVRNPTGPANTGDTSTPTPTPTATPSVTETPTVMETPTVTEEPPRSPTPTPTPTPDRRHDAITPDPTRPSHPPEEPAPAPDSAPEPELVSAPRCTADDRRRLKAGLVAKYQAEWEKAIKKERRAVARRYARHGNAPPEAKVLRPITYEVEFSEACEPVRVRAAYRWLISWNDFVSLFGWCSKKMDASKTFECMKDEAGWRCG